MKTVKKRHSKEIASILLLFLFFGVIYVAGSFLKIKTISGETAPVLNMSYLKGSLIIVIVIIVLTLIRDFIKMGVKDKPRFLLLTTACVNISTAILYVIWLNDRKIKDIQFINDMNQRLSNHGAALFLVSNAARIYACFTVLGLLVDLVCVAVNTGKQGE